MLKLGPKGRNKIGNRAEMHPKIIPKSRYISMPTIDRKSFEKTLKYEDVKSWKTRNWHVSKHIENGIEHIV